ncbi:MAG: protein kinase domain-containing protein [Persicimonas sp.]
MTTEEALEEESDQQSEAENSEAEDESVDEVEPDKDDASGDSSDAQPEGEAPAEGSEGLYERLEELGSGGVGTVWRARQRKLDREVALKEVNEIFNVFADLSREDVVSRFTEAVQAQAGLVHPNVVQILDIDTDGEFPFVVSEFAPLGNLRRVIDPQDPPSLGVALKYFTQILSGLAAAHDRGLVHGNLKPENVVLDAAGNAMLSDFGLSDLVERDEDASSHVYVGVGTVAYMSPEQFQNPQAATVRSDIYSLGIMFYEMLAGKVPGRRSPMPSGVAPEIPESIDDIFDKMSRDEPEERYETVDQILADFFGSAEIVGLLDVRAPALFYRDPVEHGELGGVVDPEAVPSAAAQPVSEPVAQVAMEESSVSSGMEESSAAAVGGAEPVVSEVTGGDDVDVEETAVADPSLVDEQPAVDGSTDVQPAEEVDQVVEAVAGGDDAPEGDDVLEKLDKYGELFEDES